MIKIIVGDSIDIVIKTNKMEGSLQGFSDFHGDKVTNMLEEYFKSMKITEDPPEKEKEVEEFANALDKMILEDESINEEKVFDETKCMCRLFNKGNPKQCKSRRVNGTVYCTRHFKKIEEDGIYDFGLMNEDIPTHHPSGSKKEGKRIKWSDDISSNDDVDKGESNKKKCSNCGECGHNKKTCVKKDIIVVKKEKVVVEKVVDEKVCSQCKNVPKDNNFTMVKDNMYCYICYKVFIEKCSDCNEYPCDCDTESMSDVDKKESEDIISGDISEDTNEYIYFQGVHYYYDNETNIVAYDYEEIGIWNVKSETIDWHNTDCENTHKSNPDYNP